MNPEHRTLLTATATLVLPSAASAQPLQPKASPRYLESIDKA